MSSMEVSTHENGMNLLLDLDLDPSTESMHSTRCSGSGSSSSSYGSARSNGGEKESSMQESRKTATLTASGTIPRTTLNGVNATDNTRKAEDAQDAPTPTLTPDQRVPSTTSTCVHREELAGSAATGSAGLRTTTTVTTGRQMHLHMYTSARDASGSTGTQHQVTPTPHKISIAKSSKENPSTKVDVAAANSKLNLPELSEATISALKGNTCDHTNGHAQTNTDPTKATLTSFPVNDECTALAFAPSGNFLLACFSDGTLRLFDLTGEQKRNHDVHSGRRTISGKVVCSKKHQRFGAVACQILAKGVHTSLVMALDISPDGLYAFSGVARGSSDLVAVHLGDLEAAYRAERSGDGGFLASRDPKKYEDTREGTATTTGIDMLDLVDVYRHSDAKLRGFGACTRLQHAHASSSTVGISTPPPPPQYLLLTGRGIKNIHIWLFQPPQRPEEEPIWQQLYNASTNGNTIKLVHFRHNSAGTLQAISKSDGQKLRVWDLSYEERKKETLSSQESSKKRPSKPPFQDIAHTESTLGVAGGFAVCGGSELFNQMSIVSLDLDSKYNHTELALPGVTPSSGHRRRQQRGDLKSVETVAGMVQDATHVLLELSDGSVVHYIQNQLGLPTLKQLPLDLPGFGVPPEGFGRTMCIGRIGSVQLAVAAVATYNHSVGKGRIFLRIIDSPDKVKLLETQVSRTPMAESKQSRSTLSVSSNSKQTNVPGSTFTGAQTFETAKAIRRKDLLASSHKKESGIDRLNTSLVTPMATTNRPSLHPDPFQQQAHVTFSQQGVDNSLEPIARRLDDSTPIASTKLRIQIPAAKTRDTMGTKRKSRDQSSIPEEVSLIKRAKKVSKKSIPLTEVVPRKCAGAQLDGHVTSKERVPKTKPKTVRLRREEGGILKSPVVLKDTPIESPHIPRKKPAEVTKKAKDALVRSSSSLSSVTPTTTLTRGCVTSAFVPTPPSSLKCDSSTAAILMPPKPAVATPLAREKTTVARVPSARPTNGSYVGGGARKDGARQPRVKSPDPELRKMIQHKCNKQISRLRKLLREKRQSMEDSTSNTTTALSGDASFGQARTRLANEHRAAHHLLRKRILGAALSTLESIRDNPSISAVDEAKKFLGRAMTSFQDLAEMMLSRQRMEVATLAAQQSYALRVPTVPRVEVEFLYPTVFQQALSEGVPKL